MTLLNNSYKKVSSKDIKINTEYRVLSSRIKPDFRKITVIKKIKRKYADGIYKTAFLTKEVKTYVFFDELYYI